MIKAKKVSQVILFTLLLAISLLYVVPVIMMSFGSLKSQEEAIEFNLTPPKEAQWSNYAHVIERGKILNGYKNSIFLTSVSTFATIVIGGFAGITISRRRDRISSGLYYYFLFGITITLQIAATFSLLKTLNIYGTYLSAIAIFTAQRMPFTIMTFTSFVKGVPRDIDEAAIVDGAGVFRLYTQILMPILKPIILTNTIVTIISVWNNFNVILFFLNSSKKATISLTIYNFFGMFARDWHYVCAALVLTILPVVLVYLWLQRYIVAGMTSGAVKG
ncbi:MAG: carbohydrate ABC transporter permease [Spirochaetales bacterium]|nr:carbohydrate ABC transporter permease [Spirochaetales bacterium]